MLKRERDLRRAFEALGFTVDDVTTTSRGHFDLMLISPRGGRHRIIVSGTPGDHRHHAKNISFLKRILRAEEAVAKVACGSRSNIASAPPARRAG